MMDEIMISAQIHELSVKLNLRQRELRKLKKNRENLEEAFEKFRQLEIRLNNELEEKLSNMDVLLYEYSNSKLSQNLYRAMKSKCKSPKYEKAIQDLRQGVKKIQQNYDNNEDRIEYTEKTIQQLEYQISVLRNRQNAL